MAINLPNQNIGPSPEDLFAEEREATAEEFRSVGCFGLTLLLCIAILVVAIIAVIMTVQ